MFLDRFFRNISILSLWCIAAANLLMAQFGFLRTDVPTGIGPSAAIVGDYNGDGLPDVAVGTDDGLYVLLNAGGGSFAAAVQTVTIGNAFWLPKSGDFNEDGWDDLVGSGFLHVSRGDGTFETLDYIGIQEAVGLGDFDGDGHLDLAIARGEGGVYALPGNGDGTFRTAIPVTDARAKQVWVADLGGNSQDDIAVNPVPTGPPPLKDTLLVFLAEGAGFGSPTQTEIVTPMYVADFNKDGFGDLLYGGRPPSTTSEAQIALNLGNGTFGAAMAPYSEPLAGSWSAIADFDGDGNFDLIVTAYSTSPGPQAQLYPGNGDGTMGAPIVILDPKNVPSYGAAADFDGDGRADWAAPNTRSTNSAVIFLARDEWEPSMRRALSATLDSTVVSPGSLASLYAPPDAPFPVANDEGGSAPWPTSLGGISLQVQDSTGAAILAPLLFVSQGQVNFQVPPETALGEATLSFLAGDGATVAGSMHVHEVAPALFPFYTGVMVAPDGTQTPVAEVICSPDWGCYNDFLPFSTAGDNVFYLTFYGTGFHGANTDNVTSTVMTFGSGRPTIEVPVVAAGEMGIPGVDQITIRIMPDSLQPTYDEWTVGVTLRINGQPAESALVWGL